MDRRKLEVADVFRRYGSDYRQKFRASLSMAQCRVMTAIEACRTAALGGHVERCDRCGHQRIWFNSCSNRHCPQCQSLARAEWIEDRQSEILETGYFHVVFTVPEEIAAIALQNKRAVYGILFRATAETLQTIAADPRHLGAAIGFFAVLHTWGQNLLHHPHLHCVVPGGGLSLDGTRWVCCRANFFLPVRVLSRLFRRLFLKYLEKAFDSSKLQFFGSLEPLRDARTFHASIAPLKQTEWVVYAKPPFAGPKKVLEYVGRYTHRVAISNNRLLGMEQDHVTFHWNDYRHNHRQKTMTLPAEGFIRRFFDSRPAGWISTYPLLWLSQQPATGEKLTLCRQLLGMPTADPETAGAVQPTRDDYAALYEKLTGSSLRQCPACRQGRMAEVEILAPSVPAITDTS